MIHILGATIKILITVKLLVKYFRWNDVFGVIPCEISGILVQSGPVGAIDSFYFRYHCTLNSLTISITSLVPQQKSTKLWRTNKQKFVGKCDRNLHSNKNEHYKLSSSVE